MNITKINVSYGRTFNLGNFNSLRSECQMEAEVGEYENTEKAVEALQEECREHVRREWQRFCEENPE